MAYKYHTTIYASSGELVHESKGPITEDKTKPGYVVADRVLSEQFENLDNLSNMEHQIGDLAAEIISLTTLLHSRDDELVIANQLIRSMNKDNANLHTAINKLKNQIADMERERLLLRDRDYTLSKIKPW